MVAPCCLLSGWLATCALVSTAQHLVGTAQATQHNEVDVCRCYETRSDHRGLDVVL